MSWRRLPWVILAGLLPVLGLPVWCQEAPYLELLPRVEQARQLELRADLNRLRRHYLEAIDLYREALEFDPNNAVLMNKLGIAYHQVQEIGDAEKYYKRATKADENYADAWNNLGVIQYRKQSYKNAVKYYERALEINPASASIRSNLGTALFAQEKYSEAIAQYRLALLIDPEVFDRRSGFGVMTQERQVENRGKYFLVLGKTFIALGLIARGLDNLRRAVENGVTVEELRNDPDFAALLNHPEFQDLLQNPPVAVR